MIEKYVLGSKQYIESSNRLRSCDNLNKILTARMESSNDLNKSLIKNWKECINYKNAV